MAASRPVRVTAAISIAAGAAAVAFVITPVTFGAFTADITNSGNEAAAGTLDMTNSFSGAALASSAGGSLTAPAAFATAAPSPLPTPAPTLAANLKPGDTRSVPITITNAGTEPATMTLNVEQVAASCARHTAPGSSYVCGAATGWGNGDVSTQMTIGVTDGATSVLAPRTLASATGVIPLPGLTGPQWAAAESHTYTVTLTLPTAANNDYQGTGVSFDLHWSGTS